METVWVRPVGFEITRLPSPSANATLVCTLNPSPLAMDVRHRGTKSGGVHVLQYLHF